MVQRVSTGSPFEQKFGYSRAVRHEDTVYVSGTTGYDYATMKMPESVGEQARNALATIDKALRQAGASIEDTVRVTYYVGDASYVDDVVEAFLALANNAAAPSTTSSAAAVMISRAPKRASSRNIGSSR